jgi:hypothetical protein
VTDTDRFRLLFGPYPTPRVRYGRVVMDDIRGEVRVVGMTAGRIPWPVGQRGRAKAPVVYAGLARALRRESSLAVAHWWGVTVNTVRVWRRALGVPPLTEGTRRLYRLHYPEVITPAVFTEAIRAANTPEANAKKGSGWRGKKIPDQMRKNLDRTGRPNSPAARAKMSAAQKTRGRVQRGANGPPWTEEEDALLDRLSPAAVAAATGRPLSGVYLRRKRLRRARGEPVRPAGRPWMPAELARLGTATDAELAAAFGRSESSVRTKRWKQSRAGR